MFCALNVPDDEYKDLMEIMQYLIKGGKEVCAEEIYLNSNQGILGKYMHLANVVDATKLRMNGVINEI